MPACLYFLLDTLVSAAAAQFGLRGQHAFVSRSSVGSFQGGDSCFGVAGGDSPGREGIASCI